MALAMLRTKAARLIIGKPIPKIRRATASFFSGQIMMTEAVCVNKSVDECESSYNYISIICDNQGSRSSGHSKTKSNISGL